MGHYNVIRDELSDFLEPANPCKDAVGAWQDAKGNEFIVYDNRYSDSESVRGQERYSVENNGELEDFACPQNLVEYIEEEADKTESWLGAYRSMGMDKRFGNLTE